MRNAEPRVGDVIAIRPNWNQAVTQEVEFSTEIRMSRSGVEQREAVRQTPRVTLVYPVAVAGAAAARMLADMRADPNKVWSVPVPWRWVRLGETSGAATETLTVEDLPFWIEPGMRLTVRGTVTEAVEVVAVDGDVLTLSAPLWAAHAAGERVYCAFPARYPDELRLGVPAPDVYSGIVALALDPGRSPQPAPPSALPSYQDLELFLSRPNWGDQNEINVSRETDRVDFGRGRIAVSSVLDFTSERRQPHFHRFDTLGAEHLLAFFMRRKGRRGSFWSPSWTKDFRLTGDVAPAATFFDVLGTDFHQAYSGSRTYNRAIHIRRDGTWQVNQITGVAEVGDATRVTFASPWAQALTPDSRLHWLFRCRFTSDTLSMTWETTSAAHAQFSLTTLPTDEDAT